MRLKRGYRWLLLGLGAGLIFFVVVVFPTGLFSKRGGPMLNENIPAVQGAFHLNYNSYDPTQVLELSSFEETNDRTWYGTGFHDDRLAVTGVTSLELASANYKPGVAFVEGIPNLADFLHLEVRVRTTGSTDAESLTVFVGTPEHPHAYRFLITDLQERWSVVRMPRDQFIPEEPGPVPAWNELNRVEFRLLSRPGRTIIANFDDLRAEKTTRYEDDWNFNTSRFLGLGVYSGQSYLLARGLGASLATLSAVPTARDFHYQAKVIQHSSRGSGLFFRGDFRTGYGYVFLTGGIDQGSWQVFLRRPGEDNKIIASGILTNVRFKKDQPVWLAVETKGEEINVSLSLDGEHYTRLAQLHDASFLSGGGVGIYTEDGAETLFNDFTFSQ